MTPTRQATGRVDHVVRWKHQVGILLSVGLLLPMFGCTPGPLPAVLPHYDEVFRKATHNSYWVDGSSVPSDIGAAGPQQRVLDQALYQHTRAFEFDIHYRGYHPGEFDVYHTDNQDNSTCYALEDCLDLMRRIDYVLPSHEVINFIIEFKELSGTTFGNDGLTGPTQYHYHHPSDLDRVLWERLGSRIYTPREFLQRCPAGDTLRECARTHGWPTVDELRGRYIINVIGNWVDNAHDYIEYADPLSGNHAAFPMRSVTDSDDDNTTYCDALCTRIRGNEIFWQVENIYKPNVHQFLKDHGVVRSLAAHAVNDPVPAGSVDTAGHVSQRWAVSTAGFQMIMTDYPWNFIEDAPQTAPLNPNGLPTQADRPFFELADTDPSVRRRWDVSLLREPGGRILFDTSQRHYLGPDCWGYSDCGVVTDKTKTGRASALMDIGGELPSEAWEVFPSTTADSHDVLLNDRSPGVGCFLARSADAQVELSICRIAEMNGGRDVSVSTTLTDHGVQRYVNTFEVHKNVVEGPGDAFRIVLSPQGGRTRVSVMTANAVFPDGTMNWIPHPINSALGDGNAFLINGVLSRQGLSATDEVLFVNTTLNGHPVTLSQLHTVGGHVFDLSFCLDGSCRRVSRPTHETIHEAATNWVAVHETEGEVFGQWRTVYTTDSFEVTTSGLGQYPVYNKFWLASKPGNSLAPIFRCVDWRRDYHQYWLSTDSSCFNPNTKEPFGLSAGILGYISTQQLPGTEPLWHVRKGTYNHGSADTHDHYFAVGDAQRDVKINQEGYSPVGVEPVGYVYTTATLP